MLKSAFTSLAIFAAAAVFPASALAGTVSDTYSSPGETSFVVPQGVNQIHIDAFGAPGGAAGNVGGAGAEVQGDLVVTPGQTLYLEVNVGGGNSPGAAGGGESDVRTCSVHATSCAVLGYAGSVTSAQTRLIVAGGGGGAAGTSPSATPPGQGGNAGLLNANADAGGSGTADGGGGATTSGPGAGGSSNDGGASGTAGDSRGLGVGGSAGGFGGGGGAGYHGGGGGGGVALLAHAAGGGGGGSSWVNQDESGVDGYLTHITGASSALGTGSARIILTYADYTPPALTLTTPSAGGQWGAEPEIIGHAGGDTGDQQNVSLSIYTGQSATGSPVQTLSPSLTAGGDFDVVAQALASGTYTVVASQSDNAGNRATVSRTFTVDAAPPAVSITDPVDGATGVNAPGTGPFVLFAGTLGTELKDLRVVALTLTRARTRAVRAWDRFSLM